MKIIHTSDWHLGNVFHGHDRSVEHRAFLISLLRTLKDEQPDALLVAGDVFDNANPSAAAEETLYEFLDEATHDNPGLQIVVTAGNHDSAARLEAPAPLLVRRGVTVCGLVPRTASGETDYDRLLLPLHSRTNAADVAVLMAVPFLRTTDLPAADSYQESMRKFFRELAARAFKAANGHPVLCMAHFYATGADIAADEHSERVVVGGQECIDARLIDQRISYTALGHIHKPQPVAARANVRYCGSALPMSFSERHYKHGVVVADIPQQGQPDIRFIAYEPWRELLRIPDEGAAAADEALKAIDKLPKANKGDSGERWPYLEIKIEETQPDPSFAHRVAEILSERAVRFCRIERIAPADERAPQPTFESLERIKQLNPLQMAQNVYRQRYGQDMPQQLTDLFVEAEKSLEQSADDE